jgi:hypothetical protein
MGNVCGMYGIKGGVRIMEGEKIGKRLEIK